MKPIQKFLAYSTLALSLLGISNQVLNQGLEKKASTYLTKQVMKNTFEIEESNRLVKYDLEDFGFQISDATSDFKNAQVILVGNTHAQHDKEISSLLEKFILDGDKILLEGLEEGINYNSLREIYDEIDYFPELLGVIKSGRSIKIIGAENIKAWEQAQDYISTIMRMSDAIPDNQIDDQLTDEESHKFYSLEEGFNKSKKKREDTFYSVIKSNIDRNSRSYFIVGSNHIRNQNLTGKLNDDNIKYIALLPIDKKHSTEAIEKHKAKVYKPKNKSISMVEIELPNGKSGYLSYHWFGENGQNYTAQQAQKIDFGDSITFLGDTTLLDMQGFKEVGLIPNQEYTVVNLE